jgi:hypothetical protein
MPHQFYRKWNQPNGQNEWEGRAHHPPSWQVGMVTATGLLLGQEHSEILAT